MSKNHRAVSFVCGVAAGLTLGGVVLAVVGWSAFHSGFSARSAPSAIESRIAPMILRASVPREYKSLANPVGSDPETLREGMEHYADHCASCHANNGSGQTLYGRGLNPPPPDLRASVTQSKTDGELYAVIQNGVRMSGMPAFGQHGEQDHGSWELVIFIRHLSHLNPDELVAMEGMNPITPSEMKERREEDKFLSEPYPTSNPKGSHR